MAEEEGFGSYKRVFKRLHPEELGVDEEELEDEDAESKKEFKELTSRGKKSKKKR